MKFAFRNVEKVIRMNLLSRILSVIVFLPMVIFFIIEGKTGFFCLLLMIFALAYYEFLKIVTTKQKKQHYVFYGLACGVFALMLSLFSVEIYIFIAGTFCFIVGFYFTLFVNETREDFEQVCVLIFGYFYISSGILCIYWLRQAGAEEISLALIWILLIATWSNDTFAYFFGKGFGKHKLLEKVSHTKTWEGAIGGGIFTVIMPFGVEILLRSFGLTLFYSITSLDVLFVVLPIVVLAPFGDLLESRLKRFYNVKDSGKILPGHGGILDRIDALLVTSVWVSAYAFFFIFNRGFS